MLLEQPNHRSAKEKGKCSPSGELYRFGCGDINRLDGGCVQLSHFIFTSTSNSLIQIIFMLHGLGSSGWWLEQALKLHVTLASQDNDNMDILSNFGGKNVCYHSKNLSPSRTESGLQLRHGTELGLHETRQKRGKIPDQGLVEGLNYVIFDADSLLDCGKAGDW